MASRYLYDVEHTYGAGIPGGFSAVGRLVALVGHRICPYAARFDTGGETLGARFLRPPSGTYNWGGWQGYGSVYQDAALWFNKGYVDQLMPMHYGYYSGYEFLNILVNGCPQCWVRTSRKVWRPVDYSPPGPVPIS